MHVVVCMGHASRAAVVRLPSVNRRCTAPHSGALPSHTWPHLDASLVGAAARGDALHKDRAALLLRKHDADGHAQRHLEALAGQQAAGGLRAGRAGGEVSTLRAGRGLADLQASSHSCENARP